MIDDSIVWGVSRGVGAVVVIGVGDEGVNPKMSTFYIFTLIWVNHKVVNQSSQTFLSFVHWNRPWNHLGF